MGANFMYKLINKLFILLFNNITVMINKVMVSTKKKVTDDEWMYKECEIIDPKFTPTINSDEFGGNKDVKSNATGYFRLEQIGNRWNIINPNGNQYIFSAINTVNMGIESNNLLSFNNKYATSTKWADDIITFFRDKKIYGLGAWSNYAVINGTSSVKKMNYTVILYLLQKYAIREGKASPGTGHFNYFNDVIPIFDDKFKIFIDNEMKKYTQLANDPYLVGYFTDNELPFYSKSLDNFLKLGEYDKNRNAAKKWLDSQCDKSVNDVNRKNFLKYIAETYSKIVYDAIKKYDKNHLILGPRLHGGILNDENVWAGLHNYVDIISINYYNNWYVTDNTINIARKFNKPFIVTEFYTKGMDSGLGNKSGAGWIVLNQNARGFFYQNFAIKLLRSKLCVGWNWLQYMDNNPLGNPDPSNVDSNKGILTIQYNSYTELLDQMRLLNRNIYDLIKYFDK